ncbi:MAG: VIT domain-containing protein, partial [Planctomycetota bacterium]
MRAVLCSIVLLLLPAHVLANGRLEVRGWTGGAPVRLTAHRVRAELNDRVARVTVEQVFHNDSHRRLEGTYLFPLPDEATVSDFAMTMGGKLVKGEVLERRKARRIYEQIPGKVTITYVAE